MGEKKVISLSEYIEEVGVISICVHLKTGPESVLHWRRGYGLPKSEHIFKLVRLSKGRLTYQSIIEPFAKSKNW